jgi:lipoprotein Spr
MVPEENVRKNNESPRFLRNISLNADPKTATNNISELQSSDIRETNKIPVLNIGPSFNIEQVDEMQFKYAIRMDVEVEKVKNKDLYQYIESWWATPYRLGGSTHKGVDCSSFVQMLMSSVYNIQIPRTAREQKKLTTLVSRDELQEGDLVFFNTKGGISHVGVYLLDNKFVHAATSGGVMISDMNDPYWIRKYLSAGRILHEQRLTSTP